MQLLRIDCLGNELRLEANMSGFQVVYFAGQPVSQIDAHADSNGQSVHQFELTTNEDEQISCKLSVDLSWQPFKLDYQLQVNDQTVEQSSITTKDIEQQVDAVEAPPQKIGIAGLASLGFKLLKSAKVIKVLFVGGSLAAYSWLFSIQFAIALILCLVFHEYGHIKAMKYFGMKTKGIYLIPFVGGLALSDDKINTRWQDVVISLMGPFFGLILSIAALIGYLITDIEILAGIAVFNALLNLFNLLPVLPLDGGHVLKSISFSFNSITGLLACVAGAALGVYVSYQYGFALLGFLLAIGSIEIIFEWRTRHLSRLLPLDRYGQIFSALWYVITVVCLCAIIYILGKSGNEALGLPLKILSS